jgi:hypothetical protein
MLLIFINQNLRQHLRTQDLRAQLFFTANHEPANESARRFPANRNQSVKSFAASKMILKSAEFVKALPPCICGVLYYSCPADPFSSIP